MTTSIHLRIAGNAFCKPDYYSTFFGEMQYLFEKKSKKFLARCKKDPIKILREGRDLLFLDTFTLVLTFAAQNVIIFL